MSLAAESRSFRRASARIASCLLIAAVAGSAYAGPTDPAHRYERIGYSIGNVAATVREPNTMRTIVVTKNGEIHRVTGDRLVDELMGTFNVSQTCDGDGVLDATWDNQSNSALFATYISPGTRKFNVARFNITGATVSAPVVLYSFPIAATAGCTDLGGGIAQANDGKLLVGTGDMGNGPGAGQQSSLVGKILRLEPNAPGGPAIDNPNPASPVYDLGVRNPTRLALDPLSGNVWFIDLGPTGTNDELNWISGGGINYAWPRASGPFGTNGFRDPAYTWTTAINPVGLVIDDGPNFPAAWAGDALVAGAAGTLYRVHPVDLNATPPNATQSLIFTPGTGDPALLSDSFMLADGDNYTITPSGEIYRLRNTAGPTEEPSDRSSITPLLVRKASGGGLQLTVENETGTDKYGFYPGTIGDFYSHYNGTPLTDASTCAGTTGGTQGCITGSNIPGTAWTTINLTQSQVDAMADKAYFVLSAVSTRAESAVGMNSMGQLEPGGMQTFGCPCPAGIASGTDHGDCADQWTLNYGKENGSVIGPVTFDTTWDCNVTLVDLSEDWCYWCHVLAPDLETIYDDFGPRGFTLITLISEDTSGNPATAATIDSWLSQHPASSNPIILDENRRVMNHWFGTGSPAPTSPTPCNGWPQSHVFDCDGVHFDVICGADPAGVRAAVDAALISCGR